ncbi:unnamed protein product [Hydatigera taeniaeformis]|uniref:Ovule protein n=1 Tax=Hydatigena taeniaeformis TaxID=6205 RepID=A0A0R3X5H5_HYDTA|nr:unnamed protein product [Hydatigera taeniaeformis]
MKSISLETSSHHYRSSLFLTSIMMHLQRHIKATDDKEEHLWSPQWDRSEGDVKVGLEYDLVAYLTCSYL